MEILKLEEGYISGTIIGDIDREINIYRGIPYAAPPVGDLRWKAPQPVIPWSGIRECTVFSPQPAQYPDVNLPAEEQKIPTGEDCLYLNVLAPARKAAEKLPVMVWFHGGALRYGSGNKPLWNSPGLPSQGIVLVTVNSRLGVLGLLAHRLLSQESPDNVSGNYLLLDMIASLKWVKKNIAAFGGDPDNVTIFGQSGGSQKVISLIASPLARGLFHRAIAQSGGTGPGPTTMADMEGYGDELFSMLGVKKEKDPLEAVRSLSWEQIIEVDQALSVELGKKHGEWFSFTGPWNLSVDGYSLPDTLENIFKAGRQNPVPLIVSSTLGELTGPGYVLIPETIPIFVGLLTGTNITNRRGYAMIFDQIPSNWKKEGMVSAHAMELHYLFGVADDPEAWNSHLPLFTHSGAISYRPLITDTDRRVSGLMMKLWAQFARTGDPNIPGLVEWPAWQPESDSYLYVAEDAQVKTGYSRIAH